ncbi:TolC family outer membrane protein [Marinomonas ostreistagni]|uniref:TolC family outer membrane protein n=1 Tax=Marinomonas ostreistagni TaxID=359209 RepID=UPI00194E87A4|nr:TolC family outer membrane protein [Marinomonas ostreistagni]MBM6550502.1 TolC family outer membrane protein [Marinomonas ostreistagni]
MRKHIIASLVAAAAAVPAHSETLLEVYNLALNHDPSLRAAAATYRADKEQVDVTRGNLYPNISFSGSLGYTKTDPEEAESFDNTQNQLAVNLDYPIYSPALNYGVDATEISLKSSGVALEQAKETLIYETLSDYFAVLTAQATLDTIRSQVKSYAGQLDRVKKQYEVGLVSITDQQDAQSAYDSILVTELNAEAQLTIALETLRQRTGRTITMIPSLSEDYPIKVAENLDARELLGVAMMNNKNIQTLDLSVELAENNIDIQKASGRTPTVSITGAVSRTDNDYDRETANRRDGATNTSSIGLGVAIPLYSGGAINASIRQAAASAEAAMETRADSIQDIELSIRNAVLQLRTLAAQVKAQKQAITSAESALEATQAGYDVGTRNIVELLDAQSIFFDAKNTYEQLRYDFVLQQITLQQLTGELNEEDIAQLNQWLI